MLNPKVHSVRTHLLDFEKSYLASRVRNEFISAKAIKTCSQAGNFPQIFLENSVRKSSNDEDHCRTSSKNLKDHLSKRKVSIRKISNNFGARLSFVSTLEKEDTFASEAEKRYNKAVSSIRKLMDKLLISSKVKFASILEIETLPNRDLSSSFKSERDSSINFDSFKRRDTCDNLNVSNFLKNCGLNRVSEIDIERLKVRKLSFLEGLGDCDSEVTEIDVQLCYN